MLKMSVQISNKITPLLEKQKKAIAKLPDEAYKVFVKETPVRSGNARRKTKLKNRKEIVADYPYAQRLDEGYSKQSPEGMVKPTEEYIINRFNQIISGK
jgi:hypothetical protein